MGLKMVICASQVLFKNSSKNSLMYENVRRYIDLVLKLPLGRERNSASSHPTNLNLP